MPTTQPPDLDYDALGRALAVWLTPYILAEVRARKASRTEGNATPAPPAPPPTAPSYTAEQCQAFVAGLSDDLLERMLQMFTLLRDNRTIDSQTLLPHIPKANNASGLAATLTNHVKRRAKKLKLAYPWALDTNLQGRVTWTDDGTTAARLVEAIEHERARRLIPAT